MSSWTAASGLDAEQTFVPALDDLTSSQCDGEGPAFVVTVVELRAVRGADAT
jgi:hypothetical protein